MPLYNYDCKNCKVKFEVLKKADEREFAQCPSCGTATPKVMSACNFTFGWTLSEGSHERFAPKNEFVKAV